jgi:hypothetical protein
MPGGEDKYVSIDYGLDGAENQQVSLGIYYWPKERMENPAMRRSPCKLLLERIRTPGFTKVAVMIGKVAHGARLIDIFARNPIRAGYAGYENWNCVSWVQEALAWAAQDGKALGTCYTSWTFVRDTAL